MGWMSEGSEFHCFGAQQQKWVLGAPSLSSFLFFFFFFFFKILKPFFLFSVLLVDCRILCRQATARQNSLSGCMYPSLSVAADEKAQWCWTWWHQCHCKGIKVLLSNFVPFTFICRLHDVPLSSVIVFLANCCKC